MLFRSQGKKIYGRRWNSIDDNLLPEKHRLPAGSLPLTVHHLLCRVLTWKDGFYNGEIKTRKITNGTDLTADRLLLQRSEQLRELHGSLLSGECDHRARRPAASLSPEDLGDAEWYYTVCMTYAFRPGQG